MPLGAPGVPLGCLGGALGVPWGPLGVPLGRPGEEPGEGTYWGNLYFQFGRDISHGIAVFKTCFSKEREAR